MSLNPPPLKIIRSHALSGSFTVAPESICVAPTAITNGHDAGKIGLNLFASRLPVGSSRPGDTSSESIAVLFSGNAHHWSFDKHHRVQRPHHRPNHTKRSFPITQAYRTHCTDEWHIDGRQILRSVHKKQRQQMGA